MKTERNSKYVARRVRSSEGFTLIELLVVVIIIGILAAIALPNFVGAQDKAREASVKGNMRTAQIAAEAYAVDQGGTYPTNATAAGYQGYFPGGPSDGANVGGAKGLVNPFTNVVEFPVAGNVANVQTARTSPPSTTGGTMGQIAFTPLPADSSYAIQGTAKNGKSLGGTSTTTSLVLSNQ